MKIITEQITIYVCVLYACRQNSSKSYARLFVNRHDIGPRAPSNLCCCYFTRQICQLISTKLVLYCPCQLKLIIFI